MRKNGFSLVEAIAGVAIVSIGIMSALILHQKMGQSNKGTRDSLNYSLFRNQVLVYMSNNLIWNYTLKGALNAEMACWLNQDHVAKSDRNCAGKTGDLVIYDIKGIVQYNFTAPDAGLSPLGKPCVGFIDQPAEGNSICPMKFSLKWTAVCEAGDVECVNPLVRIDGNFLFNGGKGQQAPGERKLDFTTFHYLKYCPDQTPGWVLADGGTAPAVSVLNAGTQVISGNTGKTLSTGFAQMSERVVPCRTIDITFQENMSSSVSGPLTLSDPENRASMCLYDEETNLCRFEFIREYSGGERTFRLRDEGAADFMKPAFLTLSDTTSYSIQIRGNRAEFAVDGRVIYTWFQKMTYPFRLRVQPASRDYSPQGFNNIQMDVRD